MLGTIGKGKWDGLLGRSTAPLLTLWALSIGTCTDGRNSPGAGAGGSPVAGAGSAADADALVTLAKEVEGIYEITANHYNLDGCGLAETRAQGQPYFVAFLRSVPAYAQLHVMACVSVDACRQTVASLSAGGSAQTNFRYQLDSVREEETLTGSYGSAVQAGQSCTATRYDAVLTRAADTTLAVDAEVAEGAAYPLPASGSCRDAPQADATDGLPCTQRHTLTGRRVASLTDGP